ncbi:MAG: radical SAM protein [Candidatus Uhrbacteria bacterium]|nr:radical SAM protein [Candidatus Uhrbacteria bacterium]
MRIVVLIPPYVFGGDGSGVLPAKAMLPQGPLLVAGLLRERGHEASVVDMVFTTDWERVLLGLERPDALLFSCHTARNIPVCAQVLKVLQEVWGELPHTVLGGNVCLELGRDDVASLGLAVDAVVRGFAHGDDVLRAIEGRVGGDIWPEKPDGNLSIPALDLLSEEVHAEYLKASGGKYPMIAFGVGCHWSCAYCAAKMGNSFLPRPLERVVEEVSKAKALGYGAIWCVDNIIFTHPDLAVAFDREVARQGMYWSGMTRAELVCRLPEGFLEGLTALKEIAMGVEAISSQVLADLGRGGNRYAADLRKAFHRINAAGIASNGFVILDLPGSSEDDFRQLYDFLEELAPSTVSWSFYNPPAREFVGGQVRPAEMGFYRWPLGHSAVPPERVVQQAMLLSGRFWSGWTPDRQNPFWQSGDEFGANFLEGKILQEKRARSPEGNLWEIWEMEG